MSSRSPGSRAWIASTSGSALSVGRVGAVTIESLRGRGRRRPTSATMARWPASDARRRRHAGRRRGRPPLSPAVRRSCARRPPRSGGGSWPARSDDPASSLDATYRANLKLTWATRAPLGRFDRDDPQHLRRTDRSDRAEHDRRPPRRYPAAAGDRRRRRCRRHDQRPDDHRAAGRRPAGRRRDPDPGQVLGSSAEWDRRLGLAVHPSQRDRRPLSLAALGQSPDRLRSTEPRRPVRDADEPRSSGSGS